MKIIVDNQKSKIITDNQPLLDALIEHFSYTIPGSAYMKNSYMFNGKKKFVSEKGVFRTGLLPKVIEALAKVNVTPELEYKSIYPISYNLDNLRDISYTLYDYQQEAVDFCLKNRRAIVKSPTGSGKTLIMASLVKCLEGNKIVILFNSATLIKQTYEFFKDFGIKDLGINFGQGYIDGKVMLSTIQSIEKIIHPYVEDADVLMVDEVHEFCKGKVTLAGIQAFPKASYRLGFTATLPKETIYQYNLFAALGDLYLVRSTQDLIEDNKLTKPNIVCYKIQYDSQDCFWSERMDYQSVYEKYVIKDIRKHRIIKSIVDEIHSNNSNSKTLILVKNLEHLRSLSNLIEGSISIEGIDKISERYKKINEFKSKPNSVIIGTKVMQTGVDIKEITHFINATEIKSEIATIQGLGRALRTHESKLLVYVYDIGSEGIKYLDRHRKNRMTSYKKEGHKYEIIGSELNNG